LAAQVARIEEIRNLYNILVRNMKIRGHLEDLDVDGRTISVCIFEKYGGSAWTGFTWLGIRSGRLL
jgi:hypothetical protein